MEQLDIIDRPSQEFLERIASFIQQEAEWSTTPFDVSLATGPFVLINGPGNELVAIASVSLFSTAWLGNVVVAKNHRRKGFAKEVVRALQREIEVRRPKTDLCLIASKLGESLYPKLGFTSAGEVSACELQPSSPPAPSSPRAVYPTDDQHDAAINLYQQSAGVSRRNQLQALFRESHQCAVLVVAGKVIAAAWARFTAVDKSESKPGVFLGPVVAKSPDFAVIVIAEVLRMKEDTKAYANSIRGVAALVPHKRGDDTGLNVFKSLGFVVRNELQYMIKSYDAMATPKNASIRHDFASHTPQYFALLGYDLG